MGSVYLYAKILSTGVIAVVGPVACEKWVAAFRNAQQLLQTWRTVDVLAVPSTKPMSDKLGVTGFDAKISGLIQLGFQKQGVYFTHIKTRGPLGSPGAIVRPEAKASKIVGSPWTSIAPFSQPPETTTSEAPLRAYRLVICWVLVHPTHQCQALVTLSGQAAFSGSPLKLGFAQGKRRDIGMRIVSRSGACEYTTAFGAPSMGQLWQRLQTLVTYCGQVKCEPLLQVHLSHRAKIARARGFEWGTPWPLSRLVEEEKANETQIKEWTRRHSTWQLVFLLWRLKGNLSQASFSARQ